MRTKGVIGLLNYTIQFENAITTGEIKGTGLTSDEALAELKKAKDKLELGIITQEECNQKKAELQPFIKIEIRRYYFKNLFLNIFYFLFF